MTMREAVWLLEVPPEYDGEHMPFIVYGLSEVEEKPHPTKQGWRLFIAGF